MYYYIGVWRNRQSVCECAINRGSSDVIYVSAGVDHFYN